jgi:LPXTG-site transpeptidase (sortase) family protein
VHRRRFSAAVLSRWEIVAWGTALAVVAAIAVLATQLRPAVPQIQVGALTTKGAAATGPVCIFEPCAHPVYTGPPTDLRIPAINVKTPLESLVLDRDGQLEAPKQYDRAGWWRDGVNPGDVGPAVIAGHVDSKDGPAVFYDLRTLRAGDTVDIVRGGQVVRFRVTEVEQYPKNNFPTAKVYQPTPGPELRLITCGGVFDKTRLSYRDNIVVYAILV